MCTTRWIFLLFLRSTRSVAHMLPQLTVSVFFGGFTWKLEVTFRFLFATLSLCNIVIQYVIKHCLVIVICCYMCYLTFWTHIWFALSFVLKTRRDTVNQTGGVEWPPIGSVDPWITNIASNGDGWSSKAVDSWPKSIDLHNMHSFILGGPFNPCDTFMEAVGSNRHQINM